MMGARENILGRIRSSLEQRPIIRKPNQREPDWNESVVHRPEGDLPELFHRELEGVDGLGIRCSDQADWASAVERLYQERNWPGIWVPDPRLRSILQKHAPEITLFSSPGDNPLVGLTEATALLARFGSVILQASTPGGRQINVFPETLLVIGAEDQIIYDLQDFFGNFGNLFGQNSLPSLVTVVTGPSRTADIEKTLILGAHGPRELIVFTLKNDSHE